MTLREVMHVYDSVAAYDCAVDCMDLFRQSGSPQETGHTQTGQKLKRDYFQRCGLKKLTRDGAALRG